MSQEQRFYEIAYDGASPTKYGPRQLVWGIRCPFCDTVTEAYVWSLAGSGKRCECGAKFVFHPRVAVR